MKVLLINLPFKEESFFKKDFFKGGKQSPLFPVGLSYIAKVIEKNGHNVTILDIYAEQLYYDDVIKKLKETNFDVVGISALVTQYKYLKWITKEIKKINPECRIVLGNGLGTACDRTVLENVKEISVCVRGEGEITFLELVNNNFNNLENISGISYRKNGQYAKNPDRPQIKDLDSLGMPAYHLFDMEKYLKAKFYDTGIANLREKTTSLRTAPIITARGCPFNCNFCGKVIPACRLKSVNFIIKEIKYLRDKYKVNAIHFMDELFVINKERTKELCAELKKLNMPWDCQGRVNLVDDETLKIMKDSGCVAIGFGIESGDAQVLKNMNKMTTPEQIKKAVLGAKKAGLYIKNQLIFGYPGETKTTLENTVKIMKEINDPGRRFSYIIPIPGTTLYQECIDRKLIIDEEHYLYMIQHGFNDGLILVNFTDFSKYSIHAMKEYYYKKMQINYLFNALTNFNYFKNLIKTPKVFIKLIILTIRHYIKMLNGEYYFLLNKNNIFLKLFR